MAGTYLLHGYFFLWISLPSQLKKMKFVRHNRRSQNQLTSSKKALVKACIRNLNGRNSGDSSKRCIFLAIKVWCIGSPFASVASTVFNHEPTVIKIRSREY